MGRRGEVEGWRGGGGEEEREGEGERGEGGSGKEEGMTDFGQYSA